MKHEKFKLENDELSFFYDFLFQYESDINHKGFNAHKLSKELRKVLANSQKNIRKPKDSNLILYTGKYVIRDFLRHLRNFEAHCNVQSVSHKNIFILYDEDKEGKCSMFGQINKAILYKLIKEINKTRKNET